MATDERSTAWRIAAASVAGSRHRRQGAPCQDAHGCRHLPPSSLALAVADGAGSARLGGRGAALAVEVTLRSMAEEADLADGEAVLRRAFTRVRQALQDDAAAQDVELRELSTTWIAALLTEDTTFAGHIGDGAVVAATGADVLATLSAPQNDGEYANETFFVTSPDAPARARARHAPGRFTRVALLSDGLQRLALAGPEQAPHLPFFDPLFRFLLEPPPAADVSGALAAFLASARVAERTDDDLTLVLAAREA